MKKSRKRSSTKYVGRQPETPPQTVESVPAYLAYWLPLLTGLLVFAVVLKFPMTGIDDHAATIENEAVTSFSPNTLFSHFNLGMYAPLTWMCYALAYRLGGADAFWYHLLSLLTHLACIYLVVRLMLRMDGRHTLALGTGILFASHPIQVESVAWIAGFSTPLYALFYLLACHAWLDYAHDDKGLRAWAWALGAFLLANLSKSAAVTLPLTLLVLDYWKKPTLSLRPRLLALAPFFLIALGFGLLTIYGRANAPMAFGDSAYGFTAFDRVFLLAYTPLFYWSKILLPIKLNIYYSFYKTEATLPFWYYGAPLVLGTIAYLAWRVRHTHPYWAVGVLFFFANISVMLPWIPMGELELRGDHYNYLAAIGIFYALAAFWLHQSERRSWLKPIGYVWLTLCMLLAFRQVQTWQSMLSVLNNAIANGYHKGGMMYFARGIEHGDIGKPTEAIEDFSRAIELQPDLRDAYKFRGSLYAQSGQLDLAMNDLNTYLRYDSTDLVTWNNLAMIHMQLGQYESSITAFNKVIDLKPEAAISYFNRSKIYELMGEHEKSKEDLLRAERLAEK